MLRIYLWNNACGLTSCTQMEVFSWPARWCSTCDAAGITTLSNHASLIGMYVCRQFTSHEFGCAGQQGLGEVRVAAAEAAREAAWEAAAAAWSQVTASRPSVSQ